jgi:hypothetical protein
MMKTTTCIPTVGPLGYRGVSDYAKAGHEKGQEVMASAEKDERRPH